MPVKFTTNFKAVAKRQVMRGRAVHAAMREAQGAWGKVVKTKAEMLSRGPLKTAVLAQYSPGLYSTLRPSPGSGFDAVINLQHADGFSASWRTRTVAIRGLIKTEVGNVSEIARFMAGTRYMRERPVLKFAIGTSPNRTAMLIEAKNLAEREN